MHHSDPYSGVDLEVGPDGNLYYAEPLHRRGGQRIRAGGDSPDSLLLRQPAAGSASQRRQKLERQGERWNATFDAGESTDADDDPLEYEWDLNGDGNYGEPPTRKAVEERVSTTRRTTPWRFAWSTPTRASIARVTVYPRRHAARADDRQPEIELRVERRCAGRLQRDRRGRRGRRAARHQLRLGNPSLPLPTGLPRPSPAGVPLGGLGKLLGSGSRLPLAHRTAPDRGRFARPRDQAQRGNRTGHGRSHEIASNPPGVNLTAGLKTGSAPFSLRVIRGSEVVLSAPASALLSGAAYPWLAWSDGGARVHAFTADHSGQYLARYIPDPALITQDRQAPHRGRGRRGDAESGRGCRSAGTPASGRATPPRPSPSPRRGSVSGFRCALDGKAAKSCSSPKTYRNLVPGKHKFKVVPVDDRGNASSQACHLRLEGPCGLSACGTRFARRLGAAARRRRRWLL